MDIVEKNYKIISSVLVGIAVICFVLFFVLRESTFKIVFNSDGGSLVPEQKVKEKGVVVKPEDPTKDGFIFDNWVLDGVSYDFSLPVTKDLNLMASWKELFDVTVLLEGEKYTKSYASGETLKIIDFGFPAKEGYKVKLYLDNSQETENTENSENQTTEEDNRKEFDLSTPITEALTLQGEYYELKQLTVKFDSAGGTPVSDVSVLEDNTIEEPKVTKDGFTFEGWFLEDKIFDFSTPITKDMTLVASWKDGSKVNVNFFVDGKKYDTVSISAGSKVTKPADPVKEGFIFEGWKHSSKLFDFDSTIDDTLTLTASFREAKIYKVTFNSDGGSDVAAQDIYEKGKVTKPSNPTKDGMVFVEWTYEDKTYDFEKEVTAHMTLKAKWKVVEDFTVSFNSDGGSNVASQTVKANNSAVKPTDPTKEGMVFVEWQLNGSAYDFSSPVNSNISLKAKWREPGEYTVSFDSDGGQIVNSQFVREGSTASKPTDPVKDDNEFVEWQLNGVAYDFSTPVTGNITLKAIWRSI